MAPLSPSLRLVGSRLIGTLVALGMVTLVGCAGFEDYWPNRARDFADCFTARAGFALGAQVRVQTTRYVSLSTGVATAGRRIGYLGRQAVEEWRAGSVGLPFPQLFAPFLAGSGVLSKAWYAWLGRYATALLLTEVALDGAHEMKSILGIDLRRPELRDLAGGPIPYFREALGIEVGATVGLVGFDLGFNPYEFTDFLVGWVGIDLGDDHVASGGKPSSEVAVESAVESEIGS